MDAIVTYDLSKQFDNGTALSGINLQIPQGSAFACIGGRKSGKTTLARLLAGLCKPTTGECVVMGLSPTLDASRLHQLVGTVLETAKLYGKLTLSQNLDFFARINEVDSNDAIDRASFLMHKLDIWEARDSKVEGLPTGILRRANLARALMHSPRLLLMDVPESGLDRESMEAVQATLSHEAEENGLTVFLCTENMEYTQMLCNGFGILKEGALIARGDLESLRQGTKLKPRAVVRLAENEVAPVGFVRNKDFWEKQISSEKEMPKLIADMASRGNQVYEAHIVFPDLREIYEAYLTGQIRRAGDFDVREESTTTDQEAIQPTAETAESTGVLSADAEQRYGDAVSEAEGEGEIQP